MLTTGSGFRIDKVSSEATTAGRKRPAVEAFLQLVEISESLVALGELAHARCDHLGQRVDRPLPRLAA